MFFCWDDMLHPLEDLALQFCVLLECNVLETARTCEVYFALECVTLCQYS